MVARRMLHRRINGARINAMRKVRHESGRSRKIAFVQRLEWL